MKTKIREMIIYCLENFPETRNSDIALTLKVWQYFTDKVVWSEKTNSHWVQIKDLFDLPREDHIKRVRASLNAVGMFMPTDPKVIEARNKSKKQWREELGYKNYKSPYKD